MSCCCFCCCVFLFVFFVCFSPVFFCVHCAFWNFSLSVCLSLSLSVCLSDCLSVSLLFDVLSVAVFVIRDRFAKKADTCLNLYPCVIKYSLSLSLSLLALFYFYFSFHFASIRSNSCFRSCLSCMEGEGGRRTTVGTLFARDIDRIVIVSTVARVPA